MRKRSKLRIRCRTEELLIDARKRLGLSQKEMAKVVGCTQSTISNIEHGRHIFGMAWMTVVHIAECYKLPIEHLYAAARLDEMDQNTKPW